MRRWMMLAVLTTLAASAAQAQEDSVYAPPAPATPDQGLNEGGVKFDLDALFLTNYVYRGVNYADVPDPTGTDLDVAMSAKISFDLGQRAPHPFIGALANVYNPDPVSRFQEFTAAIGADWNLRPLTFSLALQNYTYPEREDSNTAEGWTNILLDDSSLFHSDSPVLNPYIFGAYDYEINNGWYIEAGISHDFFVEDLSLTITPLTRLAYTVGWQQQFIDTAEPGTGWQHWDVGVKARFVLNSLFNVSRRWGQWYLLAQVFYTEHLSADTVGQTLVWGGGGIGFEY